MEPTVERVFQASTNAILALLERTLRLEARCDAMESALIHTVKQQGSDVDKTLQAIDLLTEVTYQQRLDNAERVSPVVAAEMNLQPVRIDFEEFLS